jgi:hypothetical protein
LAPPLQNKYPIIDRISLSYNLVEHYYYYVSPILQNKKKVAIEIIVKGLSRYENSEFRKSLFFINCQNFIQLLIFSAQKDFEK